MLTAPLSMRHARRVFYALTLLRWLPVGMLLPVMVLVMTDRGLSLSQVGVAAAAYGITNAVLELPTGGLADAVGRRPVLVAAAMLHLASLGLFLAATSLPAFLLSRIIGGASRALDTGPLQAWYVDLALGVEPHRDFERDLSGAGLLTGAGLGFGSLLGGAAGLAAGLPVAGGLSPLEVPVAAAVAVQVLHMVAVGWLLTEDRPTRGWRPVRHAAVQTPRVVHEGLRQTVSSSSLRLLVAAELLWGVAIVAVETLWQPRVADLVPAVASNTLLLGVIGASAFLGGAAGAALVPVFTRLLKRRTTWTAAFGRLTQAAGMAGLASASGLPLFYGIYLGFYAGNGACSVAHETLLHRSTGHQRATVLSINSLAGAAGGFMGNAGLPALADITTISSAWLVACAAHLAAVPLYLGVRPRAREDARARLLRARTADRG
jgi:MFS transporter, DHA1 family, tetracycline resistance protein